MPGEHGPKEVVIHDSTHIYYHCICGRVLTSQADAVAHTAGEASSDPKQITVGHT